MTLYEIVGASLQLVEMAADETVDQQTLQDTFDLIDAEFEDKADAYAKAMRGMDADKAAIDAEIERLKYRKETIKHTQERMKAVLEHAMIATQREKVKTPLFSFTIAKNPPAVNILDEAKIPQEYKIAQPDKVDKKAILEALKAGAEFEWAELRQGKSLRIR